MLEFMEEVLENIVNIAILFFDFVGVGIAVYIGIRSFIMYLRGNPEAKLTRAEGIITALEFLMVGEALKTVITEDWAGLAMLAGILLFRMLLTFLTHWEIKQDRMSEEVDKPFLKAKNETIQKEHMEHHKEHAKKEH